MFCCVFVPFVLASAQSPHAGNQTFLDPASDGYKQPEHVEQYIVDQSTFGRPDYSKGAEELARLFDRLAALMYVTLRLVSAIAAVVALISSLQVYMKMSHGEPGVTKAIQTLFWSCIFFIVATIVFPAMFGFRFNGFYSGGVTHIF